MLSLIERTGVVLAVPGLPLIGRRQPVTIDSECAEMVVRGVVEVVDPNVDFVETGFKDPKAMRRRWEEDGWLGAEHARLAVVRSDGVFAGDVSWKDCSVGPTKGICFEIGIALLPEHRGQGVGTRAQRLLVQYLFDMRPVHRLEAYTEVDNIAEQRALEKCGFEREGIVRETYFRAGAWRDSVLYGQLRTT